MELRGHPKDLHGFVHSERGVRRRLDQARNRVRQEPFFEQHFLGDDLAHAAHVAAEFAGEGEQFLALLVIEEPDVVRGSDILLTHGCLTLRGPPSPT